MIRVHRRGYVRSDGTRVKPATFLMKDRGRRGRTPESEKLPFRLRPGFLHGWKKSQSSGTRHRILANLIRRDGYATISRRLTALKNVSPDPGTDRAVNADLNWMRQKYRED